MRFLFLLLGVMFLVFLVMVSFKGRVRFVFLRSMRQYRWRRELGIMLREAAKFFPELDDETIYVGVLDGPETHLGRADSVNNIVFFNPKVRPSYVVVFHELAHLVVAKLRREGVNVPKTEEYISVFACARMPNELFDTDHLAYIYEPIPKEHTHKIPDLCREALRYREHRRDYIKYLRNRIKQLCGGDGREG